MCRYIKYPYGVDNKPHVFTGNYFYNPFLKSEASYAFCVTSGSNLIN